MKSWRMVVLVFVMVVFASHPVTVEAASKSSANKKIFIGLGLMAGGALITTHTVGRCLLRDCGNVEGAIGLTMFGAGATVLIWGIVQRIHANKTDFVETPSHERRLQIEYAVFPTRRGAGGALAFRW